MTWWSNARVHCILAEPEEGCQRRLKCCCNDFVDKNSPNILFMFIFTMQFKIFINVFAFLYVEVNFKEICEEMFFSSFFRKMLMSAFLLRFKAN